MYTHIYVISGVYGTYVTGSVHIVTHLRTGMHIQLFDITWGCRFSYSSYKWRSDTI